MKQTLKNKVSTISKFYSKAKLTNIKHKIYAKILMRSIDKYELSLKLFPIRLYARKRKQIRKSADFLFYTANSYDDEHIEWRYFSFYYIRNFRRKKDTVKKNVNKY